MISAKAQRGASRQDKDGLLFRRQDNYRCFGSFNIGSKKPDEFESIDQGLTRSCRMTVGWI
jgi:hypothetical protein